MSTDNLRKTAGSRPLPQIEKANTVNELLLEFLDQ